jgi:hypothetical protein
MGGIFTFTVLIIIKKKLKRERESKRLTCPTVKRVQTGGEVCPDEFSPSQC